MKDIERYYIFNLLNLIVVKVQSFTSNMKGEKGQRVSLVMGTCSNGCLCLFIFIVVGT